MLFSYSPAAMQTTKVKHRSDTSEDLIERIAELLASKGYARVTDLAEELQVQRSTVSTTIRRLSEKGLLNYEKYRGFTLTLEGKAIARQIARRHKVLTEFFSLLGLPEKVVLAEVEDVEHHLTSATVEKISKVVHYWKSHPDSLREVFT